ncbi:MAG: zinc-ribbon domain-containing protein, partial [Butyrivibrio sp.]|nr:zinc-ribbon domain-containing protein [Butyrivibrio sp.]
MPYCTNCGHFVAEGVKFCSNCGASVTGNEEGEKRQTVHQGKIYKCPN